MILKLPPLERSNKTSYSETPTACCNHQRQHRGAPKPLDNIKSPRVLQRALRCTGVFRQASEASWHWRATGPSTQGLGHFVLAAPPYPPPFRDAERGSLQRDTAFKELVERR